MEGTSLLNMDGRNVDIGGESVPGDSVARNDIVGNKRTVHATDIANTCCRSRERGGGSPRSSEEGDGLTDDRKNFFSYSHEIFGVHLRRYDIHRCLGVLLLVGRRAHRHTYYHADCDYHL